MDRLMTVTADNQGLPPSGGHYLDPSRFLPLSLFLQIGEFENVMDFTVLCCSTQVACIRKEPFDQLITFRCEVKRVLVYEECSLLPSEYYASESCDERLLPLALQSLAANHLRSGYTGASCSVQRGSFDSEAVGAVCVALFLHVRMRFPILS